MAEGIKGTTLRGKINCAIVVDNRPAGKAAFVPHCPEQIPHSGSLDGGPHGTLGIVAGTGPLVATWHGDGNLLRLRALGTPEGNGAPHQCEKQ